MQHTKFFLYATAISLAGTPASPLKKNECPGACLKQTLEPGCQMAKIHCSKLEAISQEKYILEGFVRAVLKLDFETLSYYLFFIIDRPKPYGLRH